GDGEAGGATVGYDAAGLGAGGGCAIGTASRTQNGICAFQRPTVLSPTAEAISWPSGEYATPRTISSWVNVWTCAPSATRQSRTLLSHDAEATSWPSGANATPLTICV